MPRYVLDTQSLIDIALQIRRPVEVWIRESVERGINSDEIYLSAATPARVEQIFRQWRNKIDTGTAPEAVNEDHLSALEGNVEGIITKIKNGDRLIPADESILKRWVRILADSKMTRNVDGVEKPIESVECLEIATAAAGYQGRTYLLVAKTEPHLLRVNGLTVLDPEVEIASSESQL